VLFRELMTTRNFQRPIPLAVWTSRSLCPAPIHGQSAGNQAHTRAKRESRQTKLSRRSKSQHTACGEHDHCSVLECHRHSVPAFLNQFSRPKPRKHGDRREPYPVRCNSEPKSSLSSVPLVHFSLTAFGFYPTVSIRPRRGYIPRLMQLGHDQKRDSTRKREGQAGENPGKLRFIRRHQMLPDQVEGFDKRGGQPGETQVYTKVKILPREKAVAFDNRPNQRGHKYENDGHQNPGPTDQICQGLRTGRWTANRGTGLQRTPSPRLSAKLNVS